MTALTDQQVRRALEDILGFMPSEQQWAALSAPLEPASIVAGAGSGKTAVMSARMAWSVLSGYLPADQLLGLTFTNKAAAELLGRARALLGRARERGYLDGLDTDTADADPMISTYHSFAAGLITEHGIRIGIEPHAQLLTDGARHQLAARVVAGTSADMSAVSVTPATVVQRLLALDSELSELGIDPALVRDDAQSLIDALLRVDESRGLISPGRDMLTTAELRLTLLDLVEEFRAAKQARQMLDFSDQIRWALALARQYPEVREQARQTYRLVLLDEYQDTSVAQRLLLQTLFADGHPVTAVGDPCQAIYEWRGASVVNIDRFPEHFPLADSHNSRESTRRYPLSDNRRSGPGILHLANDLSAPLRAAHTSIEPLVPAAEGKGPGHVRVAFLNTYLDEVEWVADEIARFADAPTRAGEVPRWGDVLVLARTGEHLHLLDRALRSRRIPTQLIGTASLLTQPVVAEIRSYLEVIDESTSNAALARILSGPRWRIGPRDLAIIGALAQRLVRDVEARTDEQRPLIERLQATVDRADPAESPSLFEACAAIVDATEEAADALVRLSPQAHSRLRSCVRQIRELRAHAMDPPVELISRVLGLTGLGAHILVGEADRVAERGRAVAEFMDLAGRFIDLDGRVGLAAFLARLDDAQAYDDAPTFEPVLDESAVRLMTVHKAKGLQAPHVFVTGLADGKFPSSRSRDRWPKHAHVVPWRLRDDAPLSLVDYPDRTEGPRTAAADEFKASSKRYEQEEERRLCYVAVTRAESSVTLSGYGWGSADKYRGPSEYLVEARTWCEAHGGEIVTWADPPAEGDTHPLDGARPGEADSWPRGTDIEDMARLAAHAVQQEIMRAREQEPVPLSEQALALLREERDRRRRPQPQLPRRTSVTEVIRWRADPQAAAQRLLRPMPEPPSQAAYRGQRLHAWIEEHYRARRLLDLDDIPGAMDADLDEQEWLRALQSAFMATPFAQLEPVALEEPFCLFLDGHEVRGRIDAVFHIDGRDVIVDWKTGRPGSADSEQLQLYRMAWAAITGQPLEAIDATFIYL